MAADTADRKLWLKNSQFSLRTGNGNMFFFFFNIKNLLKLDFRMNWFSCKLAKYAVAGTICVLKASFRLPTAVLWNSAPWTAAGDSLFSLHLKPSLVCQQHHTARWFEPSVNSVLAPNLTGSKIMDLNIYKKKDTCLKTIQRVKLCQSILVLGRTIQYSFKIVLAFFSEGDFIINNNNNNNDDNQINYVYFNKTLSSCNYIWRHQWPTSRVLPSTAQGTLII